MTWRRTRESLTTPKTSSYIHFHIWAATTVGIAHGTSMTARITPRPLKPELTTSAMIKPSTSSMDDRDHGELHRHDDRVPEDRVVDEVAVVLQADPPGRLETAEELPVGEAVVDRLAERVERYEARGR